MVMIIKKKNTQKIPADKILENSPNSENKLDEPIPDAYGWFGHIYQLNQVLAKMSARGIPIDKERLDNFETLVQANLDKLLIQINQLIDERERAKGSSLFNDENGDDGYRTMPKKIREMLANQATTQVVQARRKNKETGKFELIEEEQKILPRYTTLAKDKYPSFPEEYLSWFTQACESEGYVWKSDSVGRGILSLRRELNPNSLVQLKAYCKWMKYKVPESVKKTAHGKELKESVDDKALEELYRLHKDEIFKLIQDYRENAKLIGTYVPGWQPSDDGRVHAVFTFQPATGQLSSRNPNVQNAPGSGDFRKIIKAPEGHVVCEFDYTGYHALMLGYFAKSPSYMRLSSLGIHDLLAAHILKSEISKMKPDALASDLWQQTISHISDLDSWLKLEDKLLKDKLKWVKANHPYVRNKQAKPAVHGIGFGMGARKLYDMNKGSFKNMREAEQVRDVMRILFPEVFKFQDAIVEQAHRDKKLVSPFGYVRRFWEAMVYKPGKGLVGGEDAEKVKAYLPANTAFAVKKNAMLRLEQMGANEKYSLFNEVHDSLKYLPRVEDVDECIKVVVGEMTRPVDKLDGLICGVEVKLGPSWGELEEVGL